MSNWTKHRNTFKHISGMIELKPNFKQWNQEVSHYSLFAYKGNDLIREIDVIIPLPEKTASEAKAYAENWLSLSLAKKGNDR